MDAIVVGLIALAAIAAILDMLGSLIVRFIAPAWYERWTWSP